MAISVTYLNSRGVRIPLNEPIVVRFPNDSGVYVMYLKEEAGSATLFDYAPRVADESVNLLDHAQHDRSTRSVHDITVAYPILY